MSPPGTGSAASGPVIGLVGVVHVDDLERSLVARVVEAELRRRLPGHTFRWFTPVPPGARSRRIDPHADALGDWGEATVARLSALVDATVAVGPDIHDDPARCLWREGLRDDGVRFAAPWQILAGGLGPASGIPHAWAAVSVPVVPGPELAARIGDVAEGLLARGVARPGDAERLAAAGISVPVEIVGDPLVVVDRLFADDVLAERRAMLRLLDILPEGEYRVVGVDGVEALAEVVATVVAADARSVREVVVVDTDGGEAGRALVRSLAETLGRAVRRVPAAAGVQDAVAVLAGAADHVVADGAVRSVLDLYRVPPAPGTAVPDTPDDPIEVRRARIDRHFDDLAAALGRATGGGPDEAGARVARLQADLEAACRRAEEAERRLIHDRRVLAAAMRQRQAELERRARDAEASVAALLATRTFRWSARVRAVVGRIRRRTP
ncbi:MAG: hypothetical protein FJW83_07075 [Actinobacteria bacterium]|nr:hypothetical protein [Actinomycetota bacterium]